MRIAALTLLGIALLTSPAHAQQRRICEGTIRGPAGEHIVQILLEDREPVYALAMWRPPNQTAISGNPLPMIVMYYRVLNIPSGERGPLYFVHVIHAARMNGLQGTSAEVRIRRYGETAWFARQDWPTFAEAQEEDYDSFIRSVGFNSPEVLELFSVAPQVESHAVTDDNVRVSAGIWNLSYRTALDALFDRAHAEALRRASHPSESIRPNDALHGSIIGAWERANANQNE